jgi:hypothetical protein
MVVIDQSVIVRKMSKMNRFADLAWPMPKR